MKAPFKGPGDEDYNKMGIPNPMQSDSTSRSADSSLVTGNGGGLGTAAQKTLEERKKTNLPPEPPPETYEFPTMEEDATEDTVKADTAVLSEAKWTQPDTLFHQEAEVSVNLALPEGKDLITKVQVELFAKTQSGPEPISKGEGWAQADGTAVMTVPVYKPKGHVDGPVEYFFHVMHSLAKMLSGENQSREVSEMALKSADHILVPGIAFTPNSSFITPKGAQGLKPVEVKFKEWDKKYPKNSQIAVFGHTDKREKDGKGLSERRAQSAFAFITNDAAAWEKLYSVEKWGLKALQSILKDMGHYAGDSDGQDGPMTQAGFKAFQKGAGLPESGKEDSGTRKALFATYMKGKHDIKIDASRFCKVAGNPWMGCAANNQTKESREASPENGRVAFILIVPNKNFPVYFPCKDGFEAPCQAQCKKAGKRSAAGIKCLFYDELVREKRQEGGASPVPIKHPSEQAAKESGKGFISLQEGQKIAAAAKGWIGTPYVTGGESKDGADCSGSVFGIYAEAGFPFPRVSSFVFADLTQFKMVPGNEPQIGDVGYWAGHLMIYDSGAGTTRKGEAANGWSATRPKGLAFGVARHQWFDDHYNASVVWYRYVK